MYDFKFITGVPTGQAHADHPLRTTRMRSWVLGSVGSVAAYLIKPHTKT